MTQHGRHLISRWLTVARAGCAAGLLVLGAIAAVPTGAAASAPPVGTEISLRSERDVCTGVPGPAPCVYLSFTLHNGADADHYFVCVYRAYHQPGEFWDEYQQVCTDIPADRVIVDTKKWQSVTLLPTTLTFTEGEPEEFVLAAEVTTDVLPYRGSGGDKRQDGACVQQTQLHYVSGATSTILTIDGQRFDLPGGLFGAKVVDHGRCRPGTSSAVGPKTTSTLISASVFPCQDYPEGATCVEHSINVYDGFFEPDTYDVCLTVYTYPLGTGEAGSQESGCTATPLTALTLDRRRLETGRLAPVPVDVFDLDTGSVRTVSVGLDLVGTGDLMTFRTRGQSWSGDCREHFSGANTDRYVTGTATIDGVAQPLYDGYVLLSDYDSRSCED